MSPELSPELSPKVSPRLSPNFAEPSPLPFRPWYRHRWPWLLMLGPAWVLAAGCAVAYLAFTRPDAMVVDDYYRQGKAINQDLRRDRVAESRAIEAELVYEGDGQILRGTLAAAAQPLPGPIHLQLVHPTLPGKDIRLDVVADADGKWSAPLSALEATRWTVQIEGGARDWRLAGQWARPATAARLVLKAREGRGQ